MQFCSTSSLILAASHPLLHCSFRIYNFGKIRRKKITLHSAPQSFQLFLPGSTLSSSDHHLASLTRTHRDNQVIKHSCSFSHLTTIFCHIEHQRRLSRDHVWSVCVKYLCLIWKLINSHSLPAFDSVILSLLPLLSPLFLSPSLSLSLSFIYTYSHTRTNTPKMENQCSLNDNFPLLYSPDTVSCGKWREKCEKKRIEIIW